MHLTNLEIGGLIVPVEIHESGMFSASFLGEEFAVASLDGLRTMLHSTLDSARGEIPFISIDGHRGTMRGFHAGNRDVLVTWDDGEKDRLGPHKRVFRVGEVDDAVLDELRAVRAEIARLAARRDEIQAMATTKAGDLLAEVLGREVLR